MTFDGQLVVCATFGQKLLVSYSVVDSLWVSAQFMALIPENYSLPKSGLL